MFAVKVLSAAEQPRCRERSAAAEEIAAALDISLKTVDVVERNGSHTGSDDQTGG